MSARERRQASSGAAGCPANATDDNQYWRARAVQNDRCHGLRSAADRHRSWQDDRESRAGQRQLRHDLRPVAQSADERSRWELVRYNDLIARIQPEAFEFCPGEQTVDIIGCNYDAVRA